MFPPCVEEEQKEKKEDFQSHCCWAKTHANIPMSYTSNLNQNLKDTDYSVANIRQLDS